MKKKTKGKLANPGSAEKQLQLESSEHFVLLVAGACSTAS